MVLRFAYVANNDPVQSDLPVEYRCCDEFDCAAKFTQEGDVFLRGACGFFAALGTPDRGLLGECMPNCDGCQFNDDCSNDGSLTCYNVMCADDNGQRIVGGVCATEPPIF